MSKFKIFPALKNVIAKDELRPSMCNVLIQDGYIVATNANILYFAKLDDIAKQDYITGLENLDGVTLGPDATDFLSKSTLSNIEFEENRLIAKAGKTKRVFYYQNILKDGEFIGFDEITGRRDSSKDFGKFPNWRAVVPQYTRGEGADFIGLNADLLQTLQSSFAGNVNGVAIQTNLANRAILVRPNGPDMEQFDQKAILMPQMIPEFKYHSNPV